MLKLINIFVERKGLSMVKLIERMIKLGGGMKGFSMLLSVSKLSFYCATGH